MNPLRLLIHRPEVIDEARKTIETLKKAGFEVEAALGGITGKTAYFGLFLCNNLFICVNLCL